MTRPPTCIGHVVSRAKPRLPARHGQALTHAKRPARSSLERSRTRLIPIHVSLPGPPGPEGDVGDSPIRVVLEPDGKAAFHPPDMGARRVEGVAGTVLSSKSASDDDVVARVEELIRLHANHPGTAPVLHEGR